MSYLLKLLKQAYDSFCITIAKSKGIVITSSTTHINKLLIQCCFILRHYLEEINTIHAPYILIYKGCIMKRYHHAADNNVMNENNDVTRTSYKAKVADIFRYNHNMHIETVDYNQHIHFN